METSLPRTSRKGGNIVAKYPKLRKGLSRFDWALLFWDRMVCIVGKMGADHYSLWLVRLKKPIKEIEIKPEIEENPDKMTIIEK